MEHETTLEQCQRHVAEGAARIERQEMLIIELQRDGHNHMLLDAERLLHEFRSSQQLSEEHLARELGKTSTLSATWKPLN